MNTAAKLSESLFEDVARALELPENRYESAERSYKAVGSWLQRPESRFFGIHIQVYSQGSFRLGTAIRPVDDEEHYDLDIVCEFAKSKLAQTQEALQADLGYASTLKPRPWKSPLLGGAAGL